MILIHNRWISSFKIRVVTFNTKNGPPHPRNLVVNGIFFILDCSLDSFRPIHGVNHAGFSTVLIQRVCDRERCVCVCVWGSFPSAAFVMLGPRIFVMTSHSNWQCFRRLLLWSEHRSNKSLCRRPNENIQLFLVDQSARMWIQNSRSQRPRKCTLRWLSVPDLESNSFSWGCYIEFLNIFGNSRVGLKYENR